ncbi:hypothetical protein QMK19_19100 [Streptomyces sp. H10-C2]|uniref:hypothetical protein n=1 Tax=Streptomyces sp. H10-C2 TaxID=3046210 RepID=UPI0024BB5D1B|nr:hypothetical protein [Streptomyces sp. H10-C2]MDJ0371728.1 hypothetical protein [Streptomyces sp. H10-C2]
MPYYAMPIGTEYEEIGFGFNKGAEHLGRLTRVERILDAGADQLGGEACPELVVELVRSGRVGEQRIDVSVSRLLREKFVLGLFDGPYGDPDAAARICGSGEFCDAGTTAQSPLDHRPHRPPGPVRLRPAAPHHRAGPAVPSQPVCRSSVVARGLRWLGRSRDRSGACPDSR